eukprot:635118-Pelagomonas_calceolata.AAC.5
MVQFIEDVSLSLAAAARSALDLSSCQPLSKTLELSLCGMQCLKIDDPTANRDYLHAVAHAEDASVADILAAMAPCSRFHVYPRSRILQWWYLKAVACQLSRKGAQGMSVPWIVQGSSRDWQLLPQNVAAHTDTRITADGFAGTDSHTKGGCAHNDIGESVPGGGWLPTLMPTIT